MDCTGVAILFGVIGLLDDWLKVSRMNSGGLKAIKKLFPSFFSFFAAWMISESTQKVYKTHYQFLF